MQTAIDKLRELRALQQDGLLSQQEFDSRKNAILDAEFAQPGGSTAPAADAADDRPGTEIGLMTGQEVGPQNRRYRLERLIAQGGMAQVWEALDLATHAELGHSAKVALKILAPQLTQSDSHAKLLVEEATRARQLAHENIVRVYEWAQDPATASYFVIMECLEGEDLHSMLARDGPLTLEHALRLLAPVGAALDYAWDKHRLVHRDIKPGNVFVTAKGEVKLLDFGIAALARAGDAGLMLEAPASSGTSGYRAPEAGTQQGPGRALDVYSVAVMIYQMVTGRLPSDGAPEQRTAPTQAPGLTERQWKVLLAGFAPDPALRPASVSALLANMHGAAGPSTAELAAQQAAASARETRRTKALAERDKAQARAEAAAKALQDRQQKEKDKEKEKRERAATEVVRRARKEALRQQLLERRAADAEAARVAQEEAQRKALQAKAAAAYRAEQQRARAELAARSEAELAALMPAPTSAVAGPDGVLRDRFLDGSGSGPELVLIPSGRFQMGSSEQDRQVAIEAGSQKSWVARETPQHWVGIEHPFALARYPVTVGEWRAFVQATGWQQHGEVNWAAPGFAQTEAHPVVGVTWADAQQYVRWLSESSGHAYRLPSEAEWEYACRAGTRTAFSFGDSISTDLANYDGNFTYNGGPRGEYRRGTTAVGQFPPNPWGLYDMHGNVWEWVQDTVHDNYEGAPVTGRAWEEGGDPARRILRGGCWLYNPRYLRSALRNGFSSVLSNDIVGFRVARDLL